MPILSSRSTYNQSSSALICRNKQASTLPVQTSPALYPHTHPFPTALPSRSLNRTSNLYSLIYIAFHLVCNEFSSDL